MNANKKDTATVWIDPDDAPELTDSFFERADERRGAKLVRRGRPVSDNPKISTTIRLSPEVIEYFKAQGAGWQTKINDALLRQVRRKRA